MRTGHSRTRLQSNLIQLLKKIRDSPAYCTHLAIYLFLNPTDMYSHAQKRPPAHFVAPYPFTMSVATKVRNKGGGVLNNLCLVWVLFARWFWLPSVEYKQEAGD